ncbi:MAG TPA: vWA domain-containing protein [Polyangia bacterium]|nr:vWA domain-containing protein [Polyangia bacterium]
MVGTPGAGGEAGSAATATGGTTSTGGAATAGAGGIGGTPGGGGMAGGAGIPDSGGTAGGAGMPGSGGTAGSGDLGCRPDVLLVQDRSGSMNNDDNDGSCGTVCPAGVSKWSQAVAAVTQVVQTTDATVNWGVKYFSDNEACDASQPPSVPVAGMNAAAVATSLQRVQPNGNTPTRDAILTATQYMASLPDTNPKFLVLATDGLPSCPVGCASMARPTGSCTATDNPSEDQAVEAAIDMAAQMGIKTFVIGIGNVATAQNTLNQLAIAGGEAQTGAATAYYAATDGPAISDALMNIVGKITGCR